MEGIWEAWQIRIALDMLPAEEREVVRAQHFVGLSHAQIAQQLAMPIGTVKSRSHRAHRRLASSLADYPAITVTREPEDGNPASSGQVVLTNHP
jgi:DNA-directed RNA polymerase specialized sigma24 family protein